MLKPMDKDGKYPLTGREYNALRCIVLSKNEVTNSIDSLKDRFRLIPGGWRDARMIYTRLAKLTAQLLDTVPDHKRRAMQHELDNSEISIHIKKADPSTLKGVIYVDEEAFVHIMDRIIGQDCWCCEKKGREVKHCEIRNLILDALHYGSEMPDGYCELQGCSSVMQEGE